MCSSLLLQYDWSIDWHPVISPLYCNIWYCTAANKLFPSVEASTLWSILYYQYCLYINYHVPSLSGQFAVSYLAQYITQSYLQLLFWKFSNWSFLYFNIVDLSYTTSWITVCCTWHTTTLDTQVVSWKTSIICSFLFLNIVGLSNTSSLFVQQFVTNLHSGNYVVNLSLFLRWFV